MKNLFLILTLIFLSGCKTVIYTSDDVYYSRLGDSRPTVKNNNIVRPTSRPFIIHRQPQTKVVVITPRKTNLESYRHQHYNPKHK